MKANLLICCGDMGDKANPSAIKFAWDQIHRIKEALGAEGLIATAGNHDLDSRYIYNDFDAKGFLQALDPPFPFANADKNDRFWSRNFVVTHEANSRILVINSSAYHGGKEGEFERGRIAKRTIEGIRIALTKSEPGKVNIAVCHHHPFRYPDIAAEDYSEMKGGENLLELLGSGNFGRWIIIHGHRHYPRICYAAGSTSAPVIFGAGSLCAKLYGDIQNRARNQFYLLAFPWERFDELQLQLAGRFSAWDWITAKGWQRAGSESGLPAFGGFGFRPETTYVAQDLMKFSIRSPYATWKEVLETFPKLDFMVPDDLATLEGECATRHKLKLLRDANGSIVQIGSVP